MGGGQIVSATAETVYDISPLIFFLKITNSCIFKRTLAPCFFPTGEFLGKFSEHLLDEYLRLRLFFYGDNDDDATVQWLTPSSDDVLASSLIVPQPDFFTKTGRTYSLSMFLDSLSMFSDSLSMFSVNMRGNPQLFRGCL